jgi:hypothetical protein
MPVRRGYRGFEALRPDGRGTWEVYVSYDDLERVAKLGVRRFQELAGLVPDALRHPVAVFRGVRVHEADAFIYVGLPNQPFAFPGSRRTGRRDEVLVVYLTSDRVIYNWRWLPADPVVRVLPRDHQELFLERLR